MTVHLTDEERTQVIDTVVNESTLLARMPRPALGTRLLRSTLPWTLQREFASGPSHIEDMFRGGY